MNEQKGVNGIKSPFFALTYREFRTCVSADFLLIEIEMLQGYCILAISFCVKKVLLGGVVLKAH